MRKLCLAFFVLGDLFFAGAQPTIFSHSNFISVPVNPSVNSPFSSTAIADFDNDGDLDFVAAGLDGTNTPVTRIYRNTASGFQAESFPELPNLYTGSVNWGDFNNDGLLDLVITGDSIFNDNKSAVSKIFKNTGAGFVESFKGTLPPMHLGDTQWVDYNNDGFLDLLITGVHPKIVGSSFTDEYFTKLYKNTGSSFAEVFVDQFASVAYSSIDVADFNSDGLLDFAVTGSKQSGESPLEETFIYQNTSNGFNRVFSGAIIGVSFGDFKWWDYNLDGKADIVVCGANNGNLLAKVYQNGDNGFSEVFANTLKGGSAGQIDLGDFDNDGDLDLVHNGSSPGATFSEIFRNDNNAIVKVFKSEIDSLQLGATKWGDFDGDGDLDILAFGLRQDNIAIGEIYINSGGTNAFTVNQKPTPPNTLSQNVNHHAATLTWNVATDAETPAAAMNYNLYLRHNTDTIYNSQSLENGKRKVVGYGNMGYRKSLALTNLPPGDYQWSVQSIDTDFLGSAYAPKASFHINFPPQITAVTPITAAQKDTLIIKVDDITVLDSDNTYPADFTITIHVGENYSLLDNKIIPVDGFAGTLSVPVSVNDGVDESNVFNATMTIQSPITEVTSSISAVSVFPNPFNESLTLDFGEEDCQNAKVTILDVNGRPLEFRATRQNKTIVQIDNLNYLSQGFYVLKVAFQDRIVIKKIIKL